MDFSAAKRNQFPVKIDIHVHMVGNGIGGSGGWLRYKRMFGFADEVFTRAAKLLRLNQ